MPKMLLVAGPLQYGLDLLVFRDSNNREFIDCLGTVLAVMVSQLATLEFHLILYSAGAAGYSSR